MSVITACSVLWETVFAILLTLLYKKKCSNVCEAFFLAALSTFFSGSFTVTVLSDCFILSLFCLELLLIEQSAETKNTKWLIGLPVISALAVNLHATIWFVFLIFPFIYVLPFGLGKLYPIQKPKMRIKPILISVTGMLIAGLVNPYGFNLFHSLINIYSGHYEKILNLEEYGSAFQNPYGALCAFLIFIIFLVRFFTKKLQANEIYGTILFLVLCGFVSRNSMFFPLALSFVAGRYTISYYAERFMNSFNKNAKTRVKASESEEFVSQYASAISFLLAACIIFSVYGTFFKVIPNVQKNFYAVSKQSVTDADFLNSGLDIHSHKQAVLYLKQIGADPDSVILNEIHAGGYLKLSGFKKVYVDTNYEIWNLPVTKGETFSGTETVLSEYSKLFGTETSMSDEEIKNLLIHYQADFILAGPETQIGIYADTHPSDFEKLSYPDSESESERIGLYKVRTLETEVKE